MSKIYEDENGLYLKLNCHKYRPIRKTDLQKGDNAKSSMVSQTPKCRVVFNQDCIEYWYSAERIYSGISGGGSVDFKKLQEREYDYFLVTYLTPYEKRWDKLIEHYNKFYPENEIPEQFKRK